MHQPDYRDSDGIMRMPWVFLHAIKDYYEMPWLLQRHGNLKASFNLTPPLIEQLLLYEKKGIACDRVLTLLQKEPGLLGGEEREVVVKICKSSRFDTMVRPIPRYAELFEKESLNDSELVELEVLFLLSWCGNYLRQNLQIVAELLQKSGGYDAKEKNALLEALTDFIPSILPFYASLRREGRISLSTTPLNHPILPLLIDMQNAQISNPKTKLPSNAMPLMEDAEEQVDRAFALYRKVFGAEPEGIWPAEGGVDEKSVALLGSRAATWIATDEEILFNSIKSRKREELYCLHSFKGVKIFFRDHPLSDLIGFTYRFHEPKSAADDFVSRVKALDRSGEDALVSVILDGENAWEFYKNNAFDFFEALYGALERADWCRTVTMAEAAKGESVALKRLHPGSWIGGNFDTWVGHPQKNAAWELLYQTKTDYLHHKQQLDAQVKEKISYHFLAAECSDWFWWYGEDHHTEYADDFDTLFRGHLIEIYRLMTMVPPADLFRPIAFDENIRALISEPKFPIHPVIDGRVSSFFEWLGSGMIDERAVYTTMEGLKGPVSRIFWGEDDEFVYLRLDGEMAPIKKEGIVKIYTDPDGDPIVLNGAKLPKRGRVKAAIDTIMEIAISKRLFKGVETTLLRLEIEIAKRPVQTLPGVFELRIDLDQDYSENWFV